MKRREILNKEVKMEEPELKEIPEGYTSVKDRSKGKRKIWYWIELIIVLVASYTVREYQNRKAYEIVKENLPAMKTNIDKLTPEETERYEQLKGEAFLIFGKYLTLEEYRDYRELIRKAAEMNLIQDEFEKGNNYYFKVKSKCSTEEKKILVELEKISLKLAGRED